MRTREISTPRHPRTSKKQGNGEADGGGQFSHTESLAESGNGANTLVGALWASRSVGGAMLDVQSIAQHSSLLAGLFLIKRGRG
jgi:hypothetical protein